MKKIERSDSLNEQFESMQTSFGRKKPPTPVGPAIKIWVCGFNVGPGGASYEDWTDGTHYMCNWPCGHDGPGWNPLDVYYTNGTR